MRFLITRTYGTEDDDDDDDDEEEAREGEAIDKSSQHPMKSISPLSSLVRVPVRVRTRRSGKKSRSTWSSRKDIGSRRGASADDDADDDWMGGFHADWSTNEGRRLEG